MSKNNLPADQTKGQTDLAFLKNVMNHEENALHKVLKATYIVGIIYIIFKKKYLTSIKKMQNQDLIKQFKKPLNQQNLAA